MSKAMKRSLSLVLAVSIIAVGLFVAVSPAHAKTPALSEKSGTLIMGAEKTIKLTGGKGTWTVSDPDVVGLKNVKSKKVTLVPKRAGKATLVCKVGKKALRYKVKVLNNSLNERQDVDYAFAFVKGVKSSFGMMTDGADIASLNYDESSCKINYEGKFVQLLYL